MEYITDWKSRPHYMIFCDFRECDKIGAFEASSLREGRETASEKGWILWSSCDVLYHACCQEHKEKVERGIK